MTEPNETRPAAEPGASNPLGAALLDRDSIVDAFTEQMDGHTADRARGALQFVPPDLPRDEWAEVGFACKDGGLDFCDFDAWSGGGHTYTPESCRATWDSLAIAETSARPITVASLFRRAKQNGWAGQTQADYFEWQGDVPEYDGDSSNGQSAAAIYARCVPAAPLHPYVVRKHAEAAPLDGLRVVPAGDPLMIGGRSMAGALVVPARSNGVLQSLQFIPPEGVKVNLPGARMRGASFTVGDADGPAYVCEGLGTAWAVHAATGARAVVAFGSSNMATVARGLHAPDLVLVPDRGKEAEAQRVALELSARVAAMPESEAGNFDAADLAQRDGLDALRAVLDQAKRFTHPLLDVLPLDFQPRPPRWILPGLIAEGVVILAGMRGVGKTTALLPLALTAAGLHAPDSPLAPAHWRHVVYCTEDTGQAQRILSCVVDDLPLDRATVAERFHLVEARRMLPDALVKAGAALHARYSRNVGDVTLPPLVVLDTQAATLELESENDNAEASRAIAALKQRFAGLPVWLVAHVSKSAAPRRSEADGLTARGAGAWEADANQTVYFVKEDETRYMLTGKTRFEPRWRELRLESHTRTVDVPNVFGELERITLRWSTAQPTTKGQRDAEREMVAAAAEAEAEGQLRRSIRDAVQTAHDAGNPLSRSGAIAKAPGRKADKLACVERMLADGQLVEVEVPAPQRRVNSKARFLVAVADGEQPTAAQLAIPASWRK